MSEYRKTKITVTGREVHGAEKAFWQAAMPLIFILFTLLACFIVLALGLPLILVLVLIGLALSVMFILASIIRITTGMWPWWFKVIHSTTTNSYPPRKK